MVETLGIIFMIFLAILLFCPELIILAVAGVAGILDWIAFMLLANIGLNNMWQWEYRVTFSCDKSWKMGSQLVSKEQAVEEACWLVNEAANFGTAIDIRYTEIEPHGGI
jgi:hypothetical protein